MNDQEEQNKFINEKKEYFSKILNCYKNNIIITNFSYELSKIIFDVIKIGGIQNLDNIGDNGLDNYTYKALLEACRINPSFCDNKYDNKGSGWGKGQKPDPANYLKDYDPPLL